MQRFINNSEQAGKQTKTKQVNNHRGPGWNAGDWREHKETREEKSKGNIPAVLHHG